jgi:hypothetical protein
MKRSRNSYSALTTQGYFRSNCLLLSQFEIGNAFLGQRFNRPLARDQGQFRLGFLQRLFHVRLRADEVLITTFSTFGIW